MRFVLVGTYDILTDRDGIVGETVFVDAERLFEEASPHGLVGLNLVEDYVHPKPKGHRMIALALWKAEPVRTTEEV